MIDIQYPGDDGSEPEDVRAEKAWRHAREVEKKAEIWALRKFQQEERERSLFYKIKRWLGFTK